MNAGTILKQIVLSVLGTKEFSADKDGHLILSAEEAEKLNSQMKYAGEGFSAKFKEAFDANVDAAAGGDTEQSELVTKSLFDAIRGDMAAELTANKKMIEDEMTKMFADKLSKAGEATKAKELEVTAKDLEIERLKKENVVLGAKTELDIPEGVIEKSKVMETGKTFKANRDFYHNRMAFAASEGDTSMAIVAMTNGSFGNKTMGGGASDTIDVSEINQEFGTYLSDQATKMKIFKELLRPTESRQYMTKILAINEWRDAKAKIDSVVQGFIAKWTPLGKTKITPLSIPNRRHKVNLSIVPDDITGGYLTYLYNESVTPDQMPVTRYIIDELLRPRMDDDIEYKLIANGKYVELDPSAITDGQAGQATGASMDGFLTILGEEAVKVGTAMNFFTPKVAWSYDHSVDFFEDFATWVKQTNPVLAKTGMNVFVDPDMDETRRKKYREMFPLSKESDMAKTKIDFSNLTIIPLENMRGTGVMFTTPQANFIELHHINEASGATKLFLQLRDYEVRIFAEFWLATGFAIAEWVYAYIPNEASGSGA
jgi:hypothetical protein